MSVDRSIACSACAAEISSEVPEYYIELECFRMLSDREEETPRRGSKAYHEALDRLLPEIKAKYFKSLDMYDGGHLWCPVCGARLGGDGGFGLI